MLGVGLGNQRTDLSIKLDFFSGQQRCEWFFFWRNVVTSQQRKMPRAAEVDKCGLSRLGWRDHGRNPSLLKPPSLSPSEIGT